MGRRSLAQEIEAQPEPLELEQLLDLDLAVLTTTASKSLRTSAEAPAIVAIVTRSTMEAYGYRTVGEAISSLPGFFVVDDFVTANVGVRGLSGGQDAWSRVVKVLVDGQSAMHYNTGGALLGAEFIPVSAIERIEVIRGPASALYGANAFLGVINVVTRAPQERQLNVSVEGARIGTRLGFGGELLSSASAKGAGLLVAASGEQLDRSGHAVPGSSPDRDKYDGARTIGDLSKPFSILAKGNWTHTLGDTQASYLYQRLYANSNFSPMSVLIEKNSVAQQNGILSLRHTKAFNDSLELRLYGGLTHGRSLPEEVIDTGDPSMLRRERSNRAVYGSTELQYAFRRHSFLLGVDGLWDKDEGDLIFEELRNPGGLPGNRIFREKGASLEYLNLGTYTQAIVEPLKGLTTTVGLRFDRNSRWGNHFTSRAGIVWEPRKRLHLKLLYGQSFVPPSPSQTVGVALKRDGGIRGNPKLRSQTAQTGEIAASYQTQGGWSAQVVGFITEVKDRIEFIELATVSEARNYTRSLSVGGEVSAEFRRSAFFSKVDVSLQRTALDDPPVPQTWWLWAYGDETPGQYMAPNYPQIMGHLHGGLTFPDQHVQGSLSLAAVGERKTTAANIRRSGGPAPLLSGFLDLALHLRVFNLRLIENNMTEVSFHATNLLNSNYSHGGALGVDIPGRSRSVFLKLTHAF